MKKQVHKIFTIACFGLVSMVSNKANAQAGAALNFDGVDDYVSVTRLSMGDAGRSIQAWIKTTSTDSVSAYPGSAALSIIGDNTNTVGTGFGITGGKLKYLHLDSDFSTWHSVIGVTSVNDGNWHHVTVTHDASNGIVKLYVDGVLDATASNIYDQGNSTYSSYNAIGASYLDGIGYGDFFQGSIDEVRIWNRVLSCDEVFQQRNCELVGNESGMQEYYQFNDGLASADNTAINITPDLAGGDNNGTPMNFALNGASSNWITPGGVTSGVACGTVTNPEIDVLGHSYSITSGDTNPNFTDSTNFGNVGLSMSSIIVYTITNNGISDLTVNSINVTGTNSSLFVASALNPSSPITAGNSATFTLTFTPTSIGIKTATVNINNNDCDESAYNFAVQGIGAGSASSLYFDGDNDYVEGVNALLPQGNAPRTIEAWINPRSSQDGTIMNWGNTFNANERAGILYIGQKLFYVGESNDLSGNITIPANTWTHVAAIFDGTTLSLYVNGVLDISSPMTFGTTGTSYCIGKSAAPGFMEYFYGSIDEVRVWDYARTPCDVTAYMVAEMPANTSGLVANYHFNQGVDGADNSSVSTLIDSTTNANNGTLNYFTLNTTSSNWVAPGGVVTGNTTPTSIMIPALPIIHSSCSVTVTTPTTTDPCVTATYTGTTSDPLTYASAGTYTVNWSFTNGLTSITTPQTVVIAGAPTATSLAFSDSICLLGTGSLGFTIQGGYAPYAYSFGSFASGVTTNDTIWADSVIAFSSQYSSSSWSASQVLGYPNTYPNYGDISTAWTSENYDYGREFLVYHFATTNASEAMVYVTYNPGFIDTVSVRQASTGNWVTIFTGTAAATVDYSVIEHYTIPASVGAVDAIRLAMDEAAVQGWNELDAIGLIPMPQVSISGFTSGSYVLTVADSSGCTTTSTQLIGVPDNTVNNAGVVLTANQSGASYQWIDCNNGNAPIAGETNQTFTATVNGSYAVVIASATCVDTSACQTVSTVGINSSTLESSISIYPNPSNGLFTIESPTSAEITITNTLGEIVFNQIVESGKHNLNLQKETNGVYFVKVVNNNKQQMLKLIKQ